MEATTNKKRYSAELILDEHCDYIHVPVVLYKKGLMPKDELLNITSDIDEIRSEHELEIAQEAAQSLFAEKEINELKTYFGSDKGVKLITNEVRLPIRLKGSISHEMAGQTCDGELRGIFYYSDKKNNILSFKLRGYYDCCKGLNKNEERIKVWAHTKRTSSNQRQLHYIELGELTLQKYKTMLRDAPSGTTLWIGEITEGLFYKARRALSAKDTLEKVFRFLEPVSDPSTLQNRLSI